MTLNNDSFVGNQNGVLAAAVLSNLTVNNITINNCLFANNGAGDGYSHNCYIGTGVGTLDVTNSVFEGAVVGHELKSRAQVNNIIGNVFYDGPTGTASYSIDLPNGGVDLVQGNVIEKGPNAQNQSAIHFGGEGIPYGGSSLTVQGNYFVNDASSSTVAVLNQTATSVTITDNSFAAITPANIASGPATETGNFDGNGNALPDNTLTGVLPGSTLIITDNLNHTQNLTSTALNAVQDQGTGKLTVTATEGHVIAIGGSGGLIFTESASSGGNQITTVPGSTNRLTLSGVGGDLLNSQGNDTILIGGGNTTGTISGVATVTDGTGNDSWNITGTATITGTGGNPTVGVGATGNLSVKGQFSSELIVANNGGKAQINIVQGGLAEALSISGGGVSAQIYSGQMQIATCSGTQGTTLTVGVGTANIKSSGNDIIYAGSGTDTVILNGNGTVYAGTGQLSVYAYGQSDQLYGNGGTYLIGGAQGRITYYGGTQSSTVNLGLSGSTLIGGAGKLTLIGGMGETITGGSGGLADNENGGGGNRITTAAGSTNVLQLSGADVVNSLGRDTIAAGSGNQNITVGGTATITGSTGNSQITVNGTATLHGAGGDWITVNPGGVLTLVAGSSDSVSETGASVKFAGPAGSIVPTLVLSGGSASFVYGAGYGQSNSVSLTTGSGTSTSVTVTGAAATIHSNGADIIHVGSGTDTINISAANTQVYAGSGTLNVFSNGNTGLQFIAGSGTANVSLAYGGGDTITFCLGRTTVAAGWGAADVFNFLAGNYASTDIISGFRVGTDKLVLQPGVTVTSLLTAGGSSNLVLSDGAKLQLTGVTDTTHLFG
jgi:hypothetical protein